MPEYDLRHIFVMVWCAAAGHEKYKTCKVFKALQVCQ